VAGEYRIVPPQGKAGPWSDFYIDPADPAQRRIDIRLTNAAELGATSIYDVYLRGPAGAVVLEQRAIDEKDDAR
jgi:hypothetical protein